MDKKFLCAILTAAALISFVSCAPPAPAASAAVLTESQSSVPADMSAAASAAAADSQAAEASGSGALFHGILSALPENGVMSVTDANGTSFQVDASDESVAKIWDLLLKEQFDSLEATDDLFKGPYGTISLSFVKDRDKYLIKLYGCGDDHPAYPGRTLIDLESHGDGTSDFQSYAGGLAVFTEISALVDQLRGTLRVVLNQPHVKLDTGDLKGKRLTAWMQMGNRFMCAFTGEEGSQAMLFDAETGNLLGTSRVAEPVLRMEASRGESGFDYQMYTKSRVIYKNSKSHLEEKSYTPPIPQENVEGFDVQSGKIVWAAADGIYLADPEAGTQSVLLGNDALRDLGGALTPEGTLRAVNPRLMNEGEQVTIQVEADGKLAGMVLADLGSGERTGFFDVFGEKWQYAAYPDKRTFVAAGESDVTVVKVTTGESKRLSFAYNEDTKWYSGDYSTFIVGEADEDTLFTGYLVSARKANDRTRDFLKAEGRGTFQPVGASERNFFAYVDDDEGPRYILIRY